MSTSAPIRTAADLRGRRIGVTRAVRASLFEPFARAPGAAPGLGLGLYISKEIVEAHGGRSETTTAREEGTGFTVHLPRAAELGSAPRGEAPAA